MIFLFVWLRKGWEIIGVLGARREGHDAYLLYFLRSKGVVCEELEDLLMNNFFEIAKLEDANKVVVDTPDVSLFKRFGFSEVGRLPCW